ncbi:hypothetical protein FOZ60_016758, partial [Perkinsus olseni]
MWDRYFLRNSESHEDAFLSSVPVTSVDFFLSHSWSADGFWKQMALLICCSSTSTEKITLLASLMGAYAFYPPVRGLKLFELSVLAFGFVSFLVALFIIPLFKHRSTMVFLDKCCIPQKDPIAKSYGISKLADYLRASDKLLILWSPDYLNRLWCVYELAVFLQTHDEDDVILVNLDHLKLCISLMLLQFFGSFILCVAEPRDDGMAPIFTWYTLQLLGLATSLLIDQGAFDCGEEWQKFCSEVKRFNIHKAKCSSLADYSYLKQLVTDMYGSEAEFAAVVRGLWLGKDEEKLHPSWLFSRAALRIICASYIPLVVSRIAYPFTRSISRSIDNDSVPLLPIYAIGTEVTVLPSTVEILLWEIRSGIITPLMMCFRAPLILLIAHKLATSWVSEKVEKWCSGIFLALLFVAYNGSVAIICGSQMYYPIDKPPMRAPMDEVLLWTYAAVAVTVASFVLRRSYT